MNKVYLISWNVDLDWRGKAIVLACSPIQAWEKFITEWNEEVEYGEVDITPNEITKFSVELGADEFIS